MSTCEVCGDPTHGTLCCDCGLVAWGMYRGGHVLSAVALRLDRMSPAQLSRLEKRAEGYRRHYGPTRKNAHTHERAGT